MSKVHRGSGWCWDLVQHLLQTWLFKPFEAYLLAADVFLFSIFSFNKIKTCFKFRSSPVMKFKFKTCLGKLSGFWFLSWELVFWSI